MQFNKCNLISAIGFVNADSKTVIQNEVDYTLSWQRSKAFTTAFTTAFTKPFTTAFTKALTQTFTKPLLVYCFI